MVNTTDKIDEVATVTYGKAFTLGQKMFDKVFGAYPDQYDTVVAHTEAKINQYMDMVNLIPTPDEVDHIPVMVLEPGPSTRPLLQMALIRAGRDISAYKIVSIDKFDPMMGIRRDVINASLVNLPFPDSIFDTVFISSVLLYVGDRQQAMAESSRVLRPGGRLIISELDAESGAAELMKNVIMQEVRMVREGCVGTDGKINKVDYVANLIEHFGPRLRHIIGIVLRNMLIVRDSMGGFSEQELQVMLELAGYSAIEFQPKTYAGTYHLVVASKES